MGAALDHLLSDCSEHTCKVFTNGGHSHSSGNGSYGGFSVHLGGNKEPRH
jgi:hypothetical protein